MITRLRIAASRDEIFTNNTILSISEKRGGNGETQIFEGIATRVKRSGTRAKQKLG